MPATSKLRILLIDDHPLFGEAVQLVVSKLAREVTVRRFATAEEALVILGIAQPFDLLLLDLGLPGLSGEDAFAALRQRAGRTPIVIVTADPDPERARTLLVRGARGYVSKSATGAELLLVLRRVLSGDVAASAGVSTIGGASANDVELTERQREVLAELGRGASNAEIARALRISEATVRVHVSSVLRALGVESRTKAAVTPLALRLASRPPPPR